MHRHGIRWKNPYIRQKQRRRFRKQRSEGEETVSTISEQQQGRLCDLYLRYETEGLRIRLRHKPPAAEQGVHNTLQPLGYALVEL